ncbi:MAG: copper amine oxidase N-terminal domain-containing protein [Thermoanaerobacteraceae bacterium]|nr:copper amine oxidase N-terminal domain-containing protein [Thermoanaerobacteraceae bacterium]
MINKTGFYRLLPLLALTIILIFSPVFSTVNAQIPVNTDISVKVDGMTVFFHDQGPIIDENNRTLLPLKFMADEFKAATEWHPEDNTVVIKEGEKTIKLFIDNKEAEVDGQKIMMDTAPRIINDRTMVPLKFIADVFDAKVEWDDITKTIKITRPIMDYKTLASKYIKSSDMKVNNNEVTFYIKLKDELPADIIDKMAVKDNLSIHGNSVVEGVPCYFDPHNSIININKRDKSITISNVILPPQINKDQIVSYDVIFEAAEESNTDILMVSPEIKIDGNPEITPAEIEYIDFTPGKKPNSLNIVIKFTKNLGIKPVAQSLLMARYINGVKDVNFDHASHWTSWYKNTNTFIIEDVIQPEPADMPQEVMYITKYIPGEKEISKIYTIPPRGDSNE